MIPQQRFQVESYRYVSPGTPRSGFSAASHNLKAERFYSFIKLLSIGAILSGQDKVSSGFVDSVSYKVHSDLHNNTKKWCTEKSSSRFAALWIDRTKWVLLFVLQHTSIFLTPSLIWNGQKIKQKTVLQVVESWLTVSLSQNLAKKQPIIVEEKTTQEDSYCAITETFQWWMHEGPWAQSENPSTSSRVCFSIFKTHCK